MALIKGNASGYNIFLRYLQARIGNNKNNLIMCTGPTGCLSEDTKVYGQDKSIGGLYESGNKFIQTVSLVKPDNHSGGYYPRKSKSEIIPSGIKDVYEITLEDGSKVLATEEHKFFKIDKHKRVEDIVKNLKVGDKITKYNINKLDNYWLRANNKTKAKTRVKFNHRMTCIKCCNPFYVNLKVGVKSKKYCNSCLDECKFKKIRGDGWFEWEKNILRRFYYDMPKEKLLELLPTRNWSSIRHKTIRMKIKRNQILQWGKNAFNSKHNPMHNQDIKEKSRLKLIEYYKHNISKSKGKHIWEDREHPKGMLYKHHTEETKIHISNVTSGENSPHWLGGISYEPYDQNFNTQFKIYIKNRDTNQCALCSNDGSNIHHIDYNKLNSNELNCITLCTSCHSKTNFNRTKWIELFTKVMEVKYALL